LQVSEDGRHLRAPVPSAAGLVTRVVRALDEAGIDPEDVAVHQPSLDDVFLRLTGAVPAADQDTVQAVPQEILR
jgi:hypothetical protein